MEINTDAKTPASILEEIQGIWVPRELNTDTNEVADGDIVTVEGDEVHSIADEAHGLVGKLEIKEAMQVVFHVVAEDGSIQENINGLFEDDTYCTIKWDDGDSWNRVASPSHGVKRVSSCTGRAIGSLTESQIDAMTHEEIDRRAAETSDAMGKRVSERRWTKNGQRGDRFTEEGVQRHSQTGGVNLNNEGGEKPVATA